MNKDQENITYQSTTEDVFSKGGEKFHTEKYLPKFERIRKYLIKETNFALDVGVGYGMFMKLLKTELKMTAYGLDPHPKSIEIAKQYVDAEINLGKIEDANWGFEEKFDLVSCLDVVEHLENPSSFYKNVKQCLADDGIVLVTTPLKLAPYRMRSLPVLGIPDTNPTHINVKPPSYWKKMAIENGFEILESWRGEHLTHIKLLPGVLRRVTNLLKVDHRKLPILNSFEQAYNQIIKLK